MRSATRSKSVFFFFLHGFPIFKNLISIISKKNGKTHGMILAEDAETAKQVAKNVRKVNYSFSVGWPRVDGQTLKGFFLRSRATSYNFLQLR